MSEEFEIKPVKRGSAKLVVGLCAPSGEGKTYTALLMALGLAGGDPSKVGLLDTEGRGSLYSDIFDSPFQILEMGAPFSPARYISAMRQFASAGVEALVIDSMSHEHEGEGGLEEIANRPKANGEMRKIADWLTAKREHRKFMNTLLYLPCHVIACFRAREKMDFRDPKAPTSLGMQPITEKNVLFEMTASFLLHDKGRQHEEIKLPENLRSILGNPGYFTTDHGKQLRDWCGGVDPVEKAKSILRLAASQGSEALREAWATIGKTNQKALSTFKDTLKGLAEHADTNVTGKLEEKPEIP